MAKKQEMEAFWADLSQRLASDPKLAEVLESIDKSVGHSTDDARRQRLKTPYANANTVDAGKAWN